MRTRTVCGSVLTGLVTATTLAVAQPKVTTKPTIAPRTDPVLLDLQKLNPVAKVGFRSDKPVTDVVVPPPPPASTVQRSPLQTRVAFAKQLGIDPKLVATEATMAVGDLRHLSGMTTWVSANKPARVSWDGTALGPARPGGPAITLFFNQIPHKHYVSVACRLRNTSGTADTRVVMEAFGNPTGRYFIEQAVKPNETKDIHIMTLGTDNGAGQHFAQVQVTVNDHIVVGDCTVRLVLGWR